MSSDSLNAAVQALAGAVGGMFAYGLTYPLSIISTRLQVQRKQGGDQTLGKIIAAEGWKGLYGGLKAGLFGVAISQGIYYYWYAWFRRVLIENRRVKGKAISATWETIMSLIVASLAGAICTIATNPIWVVNTRMQVAMKEGNKLKENATTKDTIKEIYEKNGITGFWKGIIPALILVSNPVIQYVVFEKLKGIVEKKRKLGPRDYFLLGAIGKTVSTFVTYPYLLVKSRLHTQNITEKQEGSTQILLQIARKEGFGGFYKGIETKLVQSVLNAAFLFLAQERISKALLSALLTPKAIKIDNK